LRLIKIYSLGELIIPILPLTIGKECLFFRLSLVLFETRKERTDYMSSIFENSLTYNVFADGRLVYLGKDRERALGEAMITRCWAKSVKVQAVGNGYAYPIGWSEIEGGEEKL
jgi:hypothetical protein